MGQVVPPESPQTGVDHLSRLPVEESAELAAYRKENLKLPPTGRGRPQPGPANPTKDSKTTRKRKAPAKDQPSGSTALERSRFFIKPKPEVSASQLMKNGVFSPLTRTTTVIEIESDEDKNSTAAPSRAKKQNTSITRTETEYSFEGDDFMDNPDFFRELERVESTVLSQQYPPSGPAGPSQIRQSQNRTNQTQDSDADAIHVDTDKENEPEPVRRAKRKVTAKTVPAAPNQSVISIEDSD